MLDKLLKSWLIRTGELRELFEKQCKLSQQHNCENQTDAVRASAPHDPDSHGFCKHQIIHIRRTLCSQYPPRRAPLHGAKHWSRKTSLRAAARMYFFFSSFSAQKLFLGETTKFQTDPISQFLWKISPHSSQKASCMEIIWVFDE